MSSAGWSREIVVLFTDVPATLRALRTATQFAQSLDTQVRLLAPQCVPYPLALDRPPVVGGTLERRFHALVAAEPCQAAPTQAITVVAEVVLCRDLWDALEARLRPHSVIVVGRRSGWWPKPEDRIAGKLRAAGHHVVRTAAQKGTQRWTSSTSLPAFFSSLFAGRW
ncbi:MAG: hypothetical protein U0R19_15435 [Bryobacteraceae bacterium]